MKYQIINGNNIDVLKTFPDNHFDSIVTDPPYGIDFLGKSWDANTGALETYQECLRVLKPGGHILAFSAARTYHHLAITLEQAGFEIRDQIMWIYSSGFPKSQDVGKSIDRAAGKKDPNFKGTSSFNLTFGENPGQRLCNVCNKDQTAVYKCEREDCGQKYTPQTEEGKQWSGWGTALKPAHEPIALARKPIKLSIAKNCQKWGTGALNIDATRIPYLDEKDMESAKFGQDNTINPFLRMYVDKQEAHKANSYSEPNAQGRFPSNVIGEIAEPYQKYFYCPKVSRRERHTGFELPPPMFGDVQGAYGPDGERFAVGFDARADNKILHIGSTHPDDIKKHPLWDPSIGGDAQRLKKKILEHTPDSHKGNHHPTVKPIELMKYLIKLVTPPGGRVLDPFNGSGSTGCAAVELGHEYVGIELDPAYVEIAKKRIEAWNKTDTTYNTLFETR